MADGTPSTAWFNYGLDRGFEQVTDTVRKRQLDDLNAEVKRGEMALRRAAEERAARRQSWVEERANLGDLETDMPEYRKLAEQYPEADVSNELDQIRGLNRELSRDPNALIGGGTEEIVPPSLQEGAEFPAPQPPVSVPMPGVPATEARRQAMEAARRKFGEAKLAQEERAARAKLEQARARIQARRLNYPELNEQRKQVNRLQDRAAKLRAGLYWNAAVGQWQAIGNLTDPQQKARQDAEIRKVEAQAAALRTAILRAERARGIESTPYEDPFEAGSYLAAGHRPADEIVALFVAEGVGPHKAAEALREYGYPTTEVQAALTKMYRLAPR